MKKYLFLALLIMGGLLWLQTARLRSEKRERRRLKSNQTALMSDVEIYRTKAGKAAASNMVLNLRVSELERLRAADAESIRDLGIKLKRVESTAKTATATVVKLRAKLRDTAVVRETPAGAVIIDSMQTFRWRDPWVTVEGLIERDSVACRVESTDTLRQVVHRVPRRFLFIRWGTKALRQEIVSTNPHTRIVYAEYVKIER
nr:MAG TPA: hypothetical protein [Caudoviricetes sp.]